VVDIAHAPIDIARVAAELNARSVGYRIGALQQIRQRVRSLARANGNRLFAPSSIKADYAFHTGGRAELQFNVGIEPIGPTIRFRHVVAFSIQRSRSMPDTTVMLPLIARFNEFLRLYPESYADLQMWVWHSDQVGGDVTPAPIGEAMTAEGSFICLGRHYPLEALDYDRVMTDFDRLLPLYEFIMGAAPFPEPPPRTGRPFVPGHRPGAAASHATRSFREIDICLRHNAMSTHLYEALVKEHGAAAVATEVATTFQTRLDAVVQTPAGAIYYEIKTYSSARACVRMGLAQLLEYAYWSEDPEPVALVIVGEAPLDAHTARYLERLNVRLNLRLSYRQLTAVA